MGSKTNSELLTDIQQLQAELATLKQTSEERKAELNKSAERLSLAMRGTNDGVWDWNTETDEVYYSPRWKSMLGYDEHELEDHLSTWASLVHPDDKDRVFNKAQDYFAGQADAFDVEMRMQHKDGHHIVVLSQGFKVLRKSDNKPMRLVGTHVDITEQKKIEAYNEKHANILEMIAVGCCAADIYNEIALMYEGRHPGLRCSMLELHGNKLLHGGAPSLPKAYCDAVHGLEYGPEVGSCGTSTYTGKRALVECIETDPKWKDIKHVALPHGMRSCWSEPIISSSGKVLGAFGMYYNHPALPNEEESNDLRAAARLTSLVMERDQSQKRIKELAYTDELTGLASRAFFYQHLENAIKVSSRHKRRFGLLYIDLDDFKDVNDSLGHDAGDLLLKRIAEQLLLTCREADFVARLGGDEFCIIADKIEEDYVANVAQRCLDAISQPFELATRKLTPSCSIGIAHYPDDGDDPSTLLKAADTSLYAAKESGKKQYAFYRPELTQKAEYRFQMEQYLRDAIVQQELTLVYQPQVDVTTGKIIGVEALSRWKHPVLGRVSPIEFIATAERIGMIKQLTEWVLLTACSQAVAWKEDGFPSLRMAVNISPSHFLDKDIVSLIKRTIDETGIDPQNLELEVTESGVQTDQRNISIFESLKDLGVQLAIDDFGTGYSSLASLKHLKVDCLKIDRYFIDDMIVDNKTLLLVGTMIEMAHKLGYSIIAEGVETTEQLDIIKSMEGEAVQGYLFSKPVTATELIKLLENDFSV